jgi:hypothetical protein
MATMRITAVALISVGLAAATIVVADPQEASTPAPSQTAAPTPATPTSAPAAAEAPKTTVVVQGEQDALEKHFLAEGYKEEMHNGEKYFCRREQPMGSRLGAAKYCGTTQQLEATEREAKAAYQRGQTQQNNPSGK